MPPMDGQRSTSERWSIIEHYEAIAGASRHMLEAARAGRWDDVAVEEDLCRALIAGLKRAGVDGGTPPRHGQRLSLLRAMLADDAEIRELSEPWLQQLEALLGRRPVDAAPGVPQTKPVAGCEVHSWE